MSPRVLRVDSIESGSDEEVFSLLGHELEKRIKSQRGSPEFIAEIRELPLGLRTMAATYELDVSLALDDFGWHFGNWHSVELAEETAAGLEELGAHELAELFGAAFSLARALRPLNERAWKLLEEQRNGIFKHWVEYARDHPDKVGAGPAFPSLPFPAK